MTELKRFLGMLAVAFVVTLASMGIRSVVRQVCCAAEPNSKLPSTKRVEEFVRPLPSPLAGTLLDDPKLRLDKPDAEFRRALQKVAAESPAEPSPLAPPVVPLEHTVPDIIAAADHVSSLRQAAITLDHLAAAAESRDAYQRADSLRKLSRRLRQEARGLQSGQR